jgi:hypothetical protein
MKTILSIAALVTISAFASSCKTPADLTGAVGDSFREHVGKVVSLRGRLQEGKQGRCLAGATPPDVVFYIIFDMPPSGVFFNPPSWQRLMHKQVRVTGELGFRSFERTNIDPLMQIPPDYYYMVLQRASIEGLNSK